MQISKHANKNIVFDLYKLIKLEEPIIKNEIKHRYCLIPKYYFINVWRKPLRYYLKEHFNVSYTNFSKLTFAYFKDLHEVRIFARLIHEQQ